MSAICWETGKNDAGWQYAAIQAVIGIIFHYSAKLPLVRASLVTKCLKCFMNEVNLFMVAQVLRSNDGVFNVNTCSDRDIESMHSDHASDNDARVRYMLDEWDNIPSVAERR